MLRCSFRNVRLLALLGLPALSGCLPEDSRPSPGVVVVTVSADAALQMGTVTSDGWTISYERFLLSLGHVWVGGARNCNQYTSLEASYLRIFDMQQPGPHTVATVHALGDCALAFQLSTPTPDSVLGPGVDEGVRAFMLQPAGDAFVEDGARVVHIAGMATRSDSIRRFDWSFRQPFGYSECAAIPLRGGQIQTIDIRIYGTTPFETRLDGGSDELHFDPYAEADLDLDQQITLEELAGVPAAVDSFESLAQHLYLRLVPAFPRVGDSLGCFDGAVRAE
jgi:hypothetical protein